MKLFYKGKDGGPESHVWGYWLVELKKLFSIALLRFEDGSRDAFHSHAFNSISWLLTGTLIEHMGDSDKVIEYKPSIWPILTYRGTFHKVVSEGRSWVLTFRGPWNGTYWWEKVDGRVFKLADRRVEVS